MKHSTKRLSPWQFTFNAENMDEISALSKPEKQIFFVLICGVDGFVVLSHQDFLSINASDLNKTRFVRISRGRGTMYKVSGAGGELLRKMPRGFTKTFNDALYRAEAI
jgi:hypothetical protein